MAVRSSIGKGTTVRGNVRGDGDLDILGRVEGSVAVGGDLTIGETALVKSDVSGRRVVVRGAVAGNVSGDESLVLERGARVVGDLSAPSIGIRPGALVRGNVSTSSSGEGAGRARSTAAARPARAEQRTQPSARVPAAAKVSPPPKVEVAAKAAAAAPAKAAGRAAPPPPVVPSLKKGVKGALKRKAGR
jgi:cytoskeletal protein CcmA (bactofilin family)